MGLIETLISQREKVYKMVNVVSMQLNPRFCSQEMFNDIKNQGIEVSWLEETDLEKEQIFEITIPDDTSTEK